MLNSLKLFKDKKKDKETDSSYLMSHIQTLKLIMTSDSECDFLTLSDPFWHFNKHILFQF